MVSGMYRPYPQEKFARIERELWFQELAEHIRPHAESEPYLTDLNRALALPSEARVIHFLWMFAAEAGGNGIEYFMLEPLGHFTPQVHEALQAVGAVDLVERLEAAIPHAIESGCAEFTAGGNLEWFKKFRPTAKYPTLQSVDVDIYDLAGDDLREKANLFIQANLKKLVQ